MSMDPTELPSAGTSSSEQEDAQPLLGTRCLGNRTCGDTQDRVREDEGVLTRVRRVLWWRRMLRPGEVSGSLGDLGTFLPDVVALSNNPLGAYPVPASFVFFSGAWSLITGCSYDMPLPVQPMHTVVAVALTEGLTYAETVAAGIWLGAAFLVLGATGLVSSLTLNPSPSPTPIPVPSPSLGPGPSPSPNPDVQPSPVQVTRLQRAVPLPVVRGLQLGLGLKVVGAGIQLGTKTRTWLDTGANLDGYVGVRVS